VIRTLRVTLVLARPAVVALLGMCTAVGMAAAGRPDDQWLLARALVVVAAFLLFAISVNDLADEAIGARRALGPGAADPEPASSGSVMLRRSAWSTEATTRRPPLRRSASPGPTARRRPDRRCRGSPPRRARRRSPPPLAPRGRLGCRGEMSDVAKRTEHDDSH
jgi:hypothetical protein